MCVCVCVCVCSLSLKQIRGAGFRIFVGVFCISGRDFCRFIGVPARSAVLSSLYLFFVILCPEAAVPFPFTQSFVDVMCLNPRRTKRVGCKVCFIAATNNEQSFMSNDANFSNPRSVFANVSSKNIALSGTPCSGWRSQYGG